jgi:phage N-6-adenine-methyltransferase
MPPRDQNRRTPPWFFKLLQKYVYEHTGKKFRLDAAASPENALCKRFYTEKDNGLAKKWSDATFCNPPFAQFGKWIEKANEEALKHHIHTCVVGPTGCSQNWFHSVAPFGTILVPTHRICFYDSVTGEPTRGADRDTMIYLAGPKFWNYDYKRQWTLRSLNVDGMVVTANNQHRMDHR